MGVLDQLRTLEHTSRSGEVQAATHKALDVLGEILTPVSRRVLGRAGATSSGSKLKRRVSPLSSSSSRWSDADLASEASAHCTGDGGGGGGGAGERSSLSPLAAAVLAQDHAAGSSAAAIGDAVIGNAADRLPEMVRR